MKKLAWVLLLTSLAYGQSTAAGKPAPAFEVASVKPAPPPDRSQTMGRGGANAAMIVDDARVYIASATLADLINIAFRVRPYQVSGPPWLTASGASVARFTVQAKLPEGATKDQAPEMLQALLAERFKLVFHREEKEQSVFALIVGKGGSKLRESVPDGEAAAAGEMGKGPTNQKVTQVPGGNTIHMEQDMTIAALCDMASRFLDRPVVDVTDLKGRYHMVLELSIDDMRTIASRNGNPTARDDGGKLSDAADPTGGTIFQSVQAMGLKLDPRKMTVSRLVIDGLEKAPVEN
jgi:uncharacterized protein (TIGR03435 family)